MPPHSLPRGTEGLVAFPAWSGQPDPGTSVPSREQNLGRSPQQTPQKSLCGSAVSFLPWPHTLHQMCVQPAN